MLPLIMATALVAQYPTPQTAVFANTVPQQYVYGAAPQAPAQAYMVVQPGPMGRFLGAVGERLIRCSWPRLQPMATHAAQPAIVYLVAQQQQPMMQASYVVQAQAPPQAYGSPQAGYGQAQIQMAAPGPGVMTRPSEAVPPVPPR